MAIIYTYPTATPKATDKLIGTVTEDTGAVNVVKGNPTRSFTISALQSLFNEDVLNVVVPVTATQLKTVSSTGPVKLTLLAAPGAGKAYDIQGVMVFVDAGGVVFNAGQAYYINGPWAVTTINFPAAILNATINTDVLHKVINIENAASTNALVQNAALELGTTGAALTTGTGMVYFSITYKIVNTSSTMV